MAEYEVVWDGTATRPLGKLLFAEEQETKPLPPAPPSRICPSCGGPKVSRSALMCRLCYNLAGRRSAKP